MRCPKCQYLGFEPSPRCKNCGYDFSLSGDDLSITFDEPVANHLDDFDLNLDEPSGASPFASAAQSPTFDRSTQRGAFDREAQRASFDLDELLSHGRAESASEPRRIATGVVTPQPEDVLKIVEDDRAVAFLEPVTVRMTVDIPTPPAPVVPPPPAPASSPVKVVAKRSAAAKAPAVSAPAPIVAPEPVRVPKAAPVQSAADHHTSELPLFMQTMSEVESVAGAANQRAGMPLTIEDATMSAADAMYSPSADAMTVDSMAAMQSDFIDAPIAAPVQEIDDRPLVQVPTVLRQPLAVRRTTPDPAKLRAKYSRPQQPAEMAAAGDLLKGIDDLDSNLASTLINPPLPANRMSAEPTPTSLPAGWLQSVGPGKRLLAAGIDVVLMLALNAAVLWLTLKIVGLSPSQARSLPLIPIAMFFLFVDGGYLVLFTAACGQTIGKMAAGIRVVGTTAGAVINDRITFGQAVARSIGAIASCLPFGAGLIMSLFGDGRALHDRIAHTRVVRA